MKTLTVHIFDKSGQEYAWVRMSAEWQLDRVMPEIGGPGATTLELMPDRPYDIVTIGCIAAGAAQRAGLEYTREWEGRFVLEPSTPEDRDSDDPDEDYL